MFFSFCIAPHFFQSVKFPGFRLHYMNYNVNEINKNPLATMLSFGSVWRFLNGLFGVMLNIIGNGLNLGSTTRFADNKKISYSFRYFSQI